MTRKLLLNTLAAMALTASAQDIHTQPPPHQWQQYLEQLADYDDIEDDNMEDMYDRLCELEAEPIDLNAATDDDIRRLTFLTPAQAEELTAYIDHHRPMRSLGELAMISSMDPLRLNLLRCFVYVGEEDSAAGQPSLGHMVRHGKSELVATTQIPFYDRKGDTNGYLGYKYKHWVRYRFGYGQRLQIGLTGAQDAGEPFFAHGNGMGYDHYAYYALARDIGRVKALALGQYKLRFALGLAMNTGFSMGKTTTLLMSPPTNAITANSSRSDAYYLQGAATTISVARNVDITAFASLRKIDATLTDDGDITTILRTGYHRTESEMLRKHNASQTAAGGNIRWHWGGWHLGASAIYTSLSRRLRPDTTALFRKHNPAGKDFFNASADYGYTSHRLSIGGETAINRDGAVATLNTVSLRASSSLTLTTIQRYYSYRYHSLFASAFSDGGKVQNESGIYIGAAWNALPRLNIMAYSDYAYFPWARYRVSAASHSWDNLIQATYTLSHKLSLSARYRIRLRQEDHAAPEDGKTMLKDKTEHRARLAMTYAGAHWTAKTQADAAYTSLAGNPTDKPDSFGWMVSQNIGYNGKAISLNANMGYFHTDDHNSRIYAYERGPLYTFSFPMYYGEGMRMALFARGTITRNLIVICKVGGTKYFNRDHISSSYQQINGSWQTDMDLQVKWRF